MGVRVDERRGKTRGREKWLELTLYLRAGKRPDCSCGQACVAWGRSFLVATLKRALLMRWEFTWVRQEGFELRAGERTDCCGQALDAEGFELLRGALFLSPSTLTSFEGALFHLQSEPEPQRKRPPHPPNLCISTSYTYALPDVSQFLNLARSSSCNIHFTTSSYSSPLYLYALYTCLLPKSLPITWPLDPP